MEQVGNGQNAPYETVGDAAALRRLWEMPLTAKSVGISLAFMSLCSQLCQNISYRIVHNHPPATQRQAPELPRTTRRHGNNSCTALCSCASSC